MKRSETIFEDEKKLFFFGFLNDLQINAATFDFLIEGYPRLREARLVCAGLRTPESLAYLEAFKA